MTIYERFDLILNKVDEKIEEASVKMQESENDSHHEQYFYYMGRVHVLQEIKLMINHQIEQHQISEDLDLTLDAIISGVI